MSILLLTTILSCGEVLAQDQGFLGNRRSKPARPLAPQLKVGNKSPKSNAHKKTYRTRGTQPPKVAKKERDNRRLFFPTDKATPTSGYAKTGSGGPPPARGVRDDRKLIPSSPKPRTDNKNFGKYASSGPRPGKGAKDKRKFFPTSPDTKADTKHFGRYASSGPTTKKKVSDTRKYFPTSPKTKVDTKHFGRYASSGPASVRKVSDTRKYFPTSPDTKADTKHFGRFASSGPITRKRVPDNRKYFPTTPTVKPDTRHFGQFAQKGPMGGKPIKDQRPGKIAGRYDRSPATDGAVFNKQKYVANFHGFDSPGALWRGNLRGKEKPEAINRQKRTFMDGAYFNTPLPAKGAGTVAGLSANYQGNLIRRPTGKYSKEIANYTGHQGDLRRYRIRMTRQPATYAGGERTFMRSPGINVSGLLTFKRANKVYPNNDIAKYSGNSKRTTPNYKKTSGAYSQGDVLVKDQYQKSWFRLRTESVSYYFSNLSLGFKSSPNKQMENTTRETTYYSGRFKLSRPVKGAHPTAIYARNANHHASWEQKETNRKRNLWINRLFVFKGKDQPDDFKKKVRSPKYDRKEHQIWND